MISQARLEANRRNAQKSTGPKTKEGKAVASRNRLRHGMYASNPVMSDENPEEFAEFRQSFHDDLLPEGAMQITLVERIVGAAWRLRRMGDAERCIVDNWNESDSRPCWDKRAKMTATEVMAIEFAYYNRGFEQAARFEQRLQRAMQNALRQLKQLQKEGTNRERNTTREVPRDTGLRPVPSTDQIENARSSKSEHRQHGPEARVTSEQQKIQNEAKPDSPLNPEPRTLNPYQEKTWFEANDLPNSNPGQQIASPIDAAPPGVIISKPRRTE